MKRKQKMSAGEGRSALARRQFVVVYCVRVYEGQKYRCIALCDAINCLQNQVDRRERLVGYVFVYKQHVNKHAP